MDVGNGGGMRVEVLGCSGGIGRIAGKSLQTTSLRVDRDILIDAGTGLASLELAEMAAIDHVFITHSHLDHIAALPLMIDSIADMRDAPVTIYGHEVTLEILRNHVFNWAIWPDFSEIEVRRSRAIRFQPLSVGRPLCLGARTVTALPAEHAVPAVGYCLDSGAASLAFTGDTTVNDALWPMLERMTNLRHLIIETAFPDDERALAIRSKHLCPGLLAEELARFAGPADLAVYISHIKPGQAERIMCEIAGYATRFAPQMLRDGQVFEL